MQIYFVLSLAYFLNDCLTVKTIFAGMPKMIKETYMHHGISIFALAGGIMIGRFIGVIVGCQMLTEFSTTFLNIRSIMKETGADKRNTKCFLYNGYLLVLSFFLCRVVFLTWFTFWMCLPNYFNYNYTEMYQDYGGLTFAYTHFLALLYMLIYAINLWWFYRLVKGARRYLQENKPEAAGDEFQRK